MKATASRRRRRKLSPEKAAKERMMPLGWQLKHQWTLARPKMVAELKRDGKLFQMLEEASNRGFRMYDHLRDQKGLTHDEAIGLVMDDLQKLPEENQPEIGGPVLPYS